jgi:hypothetical protein
MRLAGTRPANQHDIAPFRQERTGMERTHQALVDR